MKRIQQLTAGSTLAFAAFALCWSIGCSGSDNQVATPVDSKTATDSAEDWLAFPAADPSSAQDSQSPGLYSASGSAAGSEKEAELSDSRQSEFDFQHQDRKPGRSGEANLGEEKNNGYLADHEKSETSPASNLDISGSTGSGSVRGGGSEKSLSSPAQSGQAQDSLPNAAPIAAKDQAGMQTPGRFDQPEQSAPEKDDFQSLLKGTVLGRQRSVMNSREVQESIRTIELQPGEELWVIAKADSTQISQNKADSPGCGALMAQLPGKTQQVPVPLKHTAVVGNIDGYIASVDVTQQFHNPYDSKIEAVYVFPLPQNAAVNDFVMTVGERKIRGIIREREKAEKIYAQARSQGHVASLMTQQRPNIFTQKVANIEPGRQIDISIRYFNTLRYDDGEYEFVFPMVVGPRYNPAPGSDGIGAVGRGTHGSSGQSTEVQYLAPNERSGHDVSVQVNINAGIEIEQIRSVNHAIEQQQASSCSQRVKLAASDTIPNKDFVLRYRVAGDEIKTAMMTHKDEHGKYFTLMIYPQAELASVQRSPMEMVFVLDCSGSMNGKPIEQAKAAIEYSLRQLTTRDTFQIIQFSNNSSQLGSQPLVATTANIEKGIRYLHSLSGSGGTQMIEGIKAALDFPHDEGRFRLVSFMTDGFIGNEQQILQTLSQKLGASRIFSFGVGSSPNRYLMDRMAILGQGAVTYLSQNDDAVEIMERFQQRISRPAMTDLTIDFGEMNVTDVYPQRIPDLIVGRPIILTGRFQGQPQTVTVGGRVDMMPQSFTVNVASEQEADQQHSGIAAVWARMKIADLMMSATRLPDQTTEIEHQVTETALNYNLMSRFTAFVAVDSLTITEGEFGTTVAVPVHVPEGVKYETSVAN